VTEAKKVKGNVFVNGRKLRTPLAQLELTANVFSPKKVASVSTSELSNPGLPDFFLVQFTKRGQKYPMTTK
jgi:hypothetical protein